MNFRRSEFDVTNRINTTDPVCVKLEVARIFRTLYSRNQAPILTRAFDDMVRMYRGQLPGYAGCDTEYHDIQHVMDVTLAMARLLDGYERSRGDGPHIDERIFQLGVICALFHDCGYIRRSSDMRHRTGAEYTTTHVSRGGKFLKEYLPTIGMEDFADVAPSILHFTGYERPVDTIDLENPMFRLVGSLLGSADIIAQMSDRCYLEKCRDRLFPEFVLGNLAGRKRAGSRSLPHFASGAELVQKTPNFYQGALKRLDLQLARAYEYAARHFDGPNPYLDEMRKNVTYAEAVAADPAEGLRRQPPSTLAPEVKPYPKDLMKL